MDNPNPSRNSRSTDTNNYLPNYLPSRVPSRRESREIRAPQTVRFHAHGRQNVGHARREHQSQRVHAQHVRSHVRDPARHVRCDLHRGLREHTLAALLPKKSPPQEFQTLNEVVSSFNSLLFTYFVKRDLIGCPL
jgi:hypothetical protein